jgi:GTP-binding protein HflX
VYIADQLFATLDPTTRRVDLPTGRQILVTDTVGFIQKLPTTLVAAFRATLEEIAEADMLLHVVDVAHPNVLQHIETVEDTLAEIEVPPIPRILVWNKLDTWIGETLPQLAASNPYTAEVALSAQTGAGVPELLTAIETMLAASLRSVKLLVPYERGDLVSLLHESASVESQVHTETGVILTVQLPLALYDRFKDYRV